MTTNDLLPLSISVASAVAFSGMSRSEIYRQLAAGNLQAVKLRKRTLILTNSLTDFIGNLRPATFRPKR